VEAIGRALPALICAMDDTGVGEERRHLSAEKALHRRTATLVRDVHDVDLRHHFQKLAGEMARAADARRGIRHRRWLFARKLHVVRKRAYGKRWLDHQDVGEHHRHGERREIAQRVVGHLDQVGFTASAPTFASTMV